MTAKKKDFRQFVVIVGDRVVVDNAYTLEEAKSRADNLDTSQGMYIAEVAATCIPKPTWVDGAI